MMEALKWVNFIVTLVFAVSYSYQFLYVPLQIILSRLKKNKANLPDKPSGRRYAALICARNEEKVIADILESINNQTYDKELITVFVLADNCTDSTSDLAREHGAVVYERHDTEHIGKGYALDKLFKSIKEDYPEGFDGYFVFDADNLLSRDYIEQMDRKSLEGHDIITSYRNSKNYGDNWVSSGYGLWFLRESRYLNHARSLLGTSCAVSGTGFMLSRRMVEELDGWKYHTLIEDIEFSIDQITKGRMVAFCETAELFDEQPVKFSQSWHQRLRWSKGYLQVLRRYGGRLFYGIVNGSFSCYDILMNIMPAFVLTAVTTVSNLILGVLGVVTGGNILIALDSLGETLVSAYCLLLAVGGITMITEWKHIRAKTWRKIFSVFTFPLFMFTFIPTALAAFFVKPEWKPIEHTVSASDIEKRDESEKLPIH